MAPVFLGRPGVHRFPPRMSAPIYLDYNATTPVTEDTLDAMLPFFREHYGNPNSDHALGWAADEAVRLARERVARVVGATPRTIVFTSGATESISLALHGLGETYGGRRHHIVTVATEHKAVLETCAALEREGFEVTTLGVDRDGQLDLNRLKESLSDKTLVVAAMWANNETGVLHPMRAIANIAHEAGALLMADATQTVGKLPVDVEAAGVDLLAFSAHKFYGPKGVGALYVRRRGPNVRLAPLHSGGSQESGLRAGTLNVPGIVGMGAAAVAARRGLTAETARQTALRDRFEAGLAAAVPTARVVAQGADRLPNTSSVVFEGIRSGDLLPALHGLAVSTGAACQTAAQQPSHVLTAMGYTDDEAFSAVRFSLGRPTTTADIDAAVAQVAEAVRSNRHRLAA